MFCPNANLWLFPEEMETRMREVRRCLLFTKAPGLAILLLNFIRFHLQGS